MIAARKILTVCDECNVFVPSQLREAVEAEERGETSSEGEAITLFNQMSATWPALQDRLRIAAASSPGA